MYRSYNARPIPRPAIQPKKSRRRGLFAALSALSLLAGAYTAFALLRPIPVIAVNITPPVMPALVRVNIPWPAAGATPTSNQAAFGADGYGLLATSGRQTPAPMASVTKTVTALSILDKKPLKPGEQGPLITMTEQDAALYNTYIAKDGVAIPVAPGQTISQYQALQAVMLPSANNIADSLAIWAFGSLDAYNAYANIYVKKLGMTTTTITDASGFAPTTVSTPGDLVKLGDTALDNPVLAEIVAQKQAEFPGYGTIRNVNNFLGQSGVRGIKTGTTDEAGGCYLAAADIQVGGKTITVITAVMGAPTRPEAMRASLPLIQSAPAQFQVVRAVRAGQTVGTATSEWGAASDIKAAKDIVVVPWTGTSVSPKASKVSVGSTAGAKTRAGQFSLAFNGVTQTTDLELAQAIEAPSTWWRLTHPF